MKRIIITTLILAVLGLALSCLFVVDEIEHAVVLRFGQPIQTLTHPGLHTKWPWPVDRVLRFDRRLMLLDVPGMRETPLEFLTRDKKNIEVSCYACWKIADPLQFSVTVGDRAGAEAYLRDIIVSELGKSLGRHALTALLSLDPGEVQLSAITQEILDACATTARRESGVEIVEYRVKRINYPEQNRTSVFERMKAERKQIATRYRSEGEEKARSMRAEADRQRLAIIAAAQREALEIKGRAEAEATRIYSDAYSSDEAFYRFLRTLESYDHSLGEDTTILLPAGMDYLAPLLGPGTGAAPETTDD